MLRDKLRQLVSGAVLAALASLVTPAVAEDGWEVTLPLYAWLPNYNFELPSGQKGEITQDDIISNVELAMMVQPRIQKGRWSLVTDFIYMDLSNKDRSQVLPFLDLRQVQLKEWVITPTVGYQVYADGESYIDVYGGARYIWIEPNLKFQRQPPLHPRFTLSRFARRLVGRGLEMVVAQSSSAAATGIIS